MPNRAMVFMCRKVDFESAEGDEMIDAALAVLDNDHPGYDVIPIDYTGSLESERQLGGQLTQMVGDTITVMLGDDLLRDPEAFAMSKRFVEDVGRECGTFFAELYKLRHGPKDPSVN